MEKRVLDRRSKVVKVEVCAKDFLGSVRADFELVHEFSSNGRRRGALDIRTGQVWKHKEVELWLTVGLYRKEGVSLIEGGEGVAGGSGGGSWEEGLGWGVLEATLHGVVSNDWGGELFCGKWESLGDAGWREKKGSEFPADLVVVGSLDVRDDFRRKLERTLTAGVLSKVERRFELGERFLLLCERGELGSRAAEVAEQRKSACFGGKDSESKKVEGKRWVWWRKWLRVLRGGESVVDAEEFLRVGGVAGKEEPVFK